MTRPWSRERILAFGCLSVGSMGAVVWRQMEWVARGPDYVGYFWLGKGPSALPQWALLCMYGLAAAWTWLVLRSSLRGLVPRLRQPSTDDGAPWPISVMVPLLLGGCAPLFVAQGLHYRDECDLIDALRPWAAFAVLQMGLILYAGWRLRAASWATHILLDAFGILSLFPAIAVYVVAIRL